MTSDNNVHAHLMLFYTNVVHKLKEENATDCQINDVKKAKNVGGICRRAYMFELMVHDAKVVKLEGAQATNLSKTVASNMLNFVDLLFRQPVDSKTNAMGLFQPGQWCLSTLNHICLREEERDNVTTVDDIYTSLTKPDIRLLVNRYGCSMTLA
ncbi:hypothetical protein L596_021472 [Steinernema carpocapsae]|uniref:Uncharacterized protein n=1 Tax=Steinernema carpocapsae TaxID=34508 RepID=A0A4U5MIV3_STECR|nr:hypothetical protein L596_021472 [Steinernema carpocapsae]